MNPKPKYRTVSTKSIPPAPKPAAKPKPNPKALNYRRVSH